MFNLDEILVMSIALEKQISLFKEFSPDGEFLKHLQSAKSKIDSLKTEAAINYVSNSKK